MSKIEDALKKIKISRNKGLTIIESDQSDEYKKSNVKDLNVSLARKSSSNEIAKMENDELLSNAELSELKIIYSDMLDNKIADTYRDLRTKIVQKSNAKNVSVMLTSCVPGYYSNMEALNLAAAFSFDDSKTSLLVECNLNNPQLDTILNLTEKQGLIDYLEDENIPVESIVHESGIKRLRVVPACASREIITEYFTSLRMKGLMSELLTRYSDRYIFVDTAPIVESADTRILVELCDYVLLVVPYGKTTKTRLKEAIEAIHPDKLLGIIFSDKPSMPSLSSLKKVKIRTA